MKFVIVLCLLSCLLWQCQSSPVQLVENHQLTAAVAESKQSNNIEIGRQSGVNNNVAQTSNDDEDDDDEDDDDDIDALVDDDDDGDDDDDDDENDPKPQGQQAQQVPVSTDEDEDDDEDDYLERLFDDILEDDDDDDDDSIPASGNNQQASPAVKPSVPTAPVQQLAPTAQQVLSQAVQAVVADPAEQLSLTDIDTLGNTAAVSQQQQTSVDYPSEGEQTVFYDEENSGIDTKVDIQSLNKPSLDAAVAPSQSAIVQKITTAQQSQNEIGSNDSNSEDDDDDDDDITGALDVDDDDDDDDDDEDDLIGEDVIEARQTRALEKQSNPTMPDILTEQYNHFVDGIFERINRILKTSYDPVRVRLATNNSKNHDKLNQKNSTTTVKKNLRKVQSKERSSITDKILEQQSQTENSSIINPNENTEEKIESKMIDSDKNGPQQQNIAISLSEMRTTPNKSNTNTSPKPSKKSTTKPKTNKTGTVSGFQSNDEKSKRAQGTLYGLSSLKRVGDVKIMPQGNNSTVKAKFTLGPLTLRVEKSFKRGSNRSVKNATAKTNEMLGRITLRIVDGSATLVSIKVQQPKQVQVDSSDNHDRTREFVWKRTPQIAHLVSDKLKLVSESILKSIGTEIVLL